jgi:hypothetical protein
MHWVRSTKLEARSLKREVGSAKFDFTQEPALSMNFGLSQIKPKANG